MRKKDLQDATESSAVYRKLHKLRHAGCSFCPWHGGDNAGQAAQRRANRGKTKRTRGR